MNTYRFATLCVVSLVGCTVGGHGKDVPSGDKGETAIAPGESELLGNLHAQFQVSNVDEDGVSQVVSLLPAGSKPVGMTRRSGRILPQFAPSSVTGGGTEQTAATEVELPAQANGAFVVRDVSTRMAAIVSLDGATNARAELTGGYVVYARGHVSGADVLHRTHRGGTEDWIHFASKPSSEALRYHVQLEGVAGLRVVSGTFEMLDAAGTPRLRMAAPWGMDAKGQRVEPEVRVEGCRYDSDPRAPWGRPVTAPGASSCVIALSWANRGAAYPLLMDPGWQSTGDMITARYYHPAILMTSGNVLVYGGTAGGALQTNKAELYNPQTGTWASTGSMSTARVYHGAVRLVDGRAIAIGGYNSQPGGGYLSSCEAYTESQGTWAALASMPSIRANAKAVLLNDGRVFVTGGTASTTSYLASTLLYNPTGNAYTAGPDMSSARSSHTATLVPAGTYSGQVFVVGGADASSTYLSNTEMYNPTSNTFTAMPSLATARRRHSAVALSSGTVKIAGGTNGSYLNSTESWTAASGWTGDANLIYARGFHSATLFSGGSMILYAGSAYGDANQYTSEVYASGSFRDTGAQAFPYNGAVLLNTGYVLVSGGLLGGGPTMQSFLFSMSAKGEHCDAVGQCLNTSLLCATNGSVCCDKQCDGATESCLLLYTGYPNGTCAPVANGAPCTAGASCSSGFCVDSVCCDAKCTGKACIQSKTGLPDGQCGPFLDGYTCAGDSTCKSGFCTDGFCCNLRCNGSCEACNNAKTQAANGLCAPIPYDMDPDSECTTGGTGVCALVGTCNGNRSCRNQAGTACSTPYCIDTVQLAQASLCTVAGGCASPSITNCTPYLRTSCAHNTRWQRETGCHLF